MRIADKMQFEQIHTNVGKNRAQSFELQNQAATQKRVTKPSDDPLAASRVLANRIDLQSNKQFSKSLGYAKSFMEYTDQSLADVTELVMRAKELAISQANDASSSETSRRVVATEVEQLYNAMVSIANRELGDRFIFGGFRTQDAPFDIDGQYAGDQGEMMIHIDKETFVPMNVPGVRLFHGIGMSADGMVKTAPPQAKSIEELEKQLANEKPLPKAEPPAGLPQTTEMRGPASAGDAPIAVASSTAEEEVPRGTNLFSVLKDLEIALRTDDKEGVQESLDRVDGAISQVVLTRSQVGSRTTILDNFMQTMERQKVDNQSAISSLEDADVFSTVSDINRTESALQATLQTSGRMVQKSLMDFLR